MLFGKGKITDLMGDLADGIKAFKKGMTEDTAERIADEPGPVHGAF